LLEAHVADTDSTPEECWRPVVGWEQFYAVSSLGRVKRTARGRGTYPGFVLRPLFNRWTGYCQVALHGEGKGSRPVVHRLVAEAFLGPRPPGTEVNHVSGVKTDNRAANLEYCTHVENLAHARRLGLLPSGDRCAARKRPERVHRGERHPFAKLCDADVREIRRLAASGVARTVLSRRYCMSQAQVRRIVLRECWAHVQ
jgi:hypothetical protein